MPDLYSCMAEPKILLIIARMFRQHAILFLKQASLLERMSSHPKEPLKWDIDSTTITRESFDDKVRREYVYEIAKRSYDGMIQIRKRLDLLQFSLLDDERMKLLRRVKSNGV